MGHSILKNQLKIGGTTEITCLDVTVLGMTKLGTFIG